MLCCVSAVLVALLLIPLAYSVWIIAGNKRLDLWVSTEVLSCTSSWCSRQDPADRTLSLSRITESGWNLLLKTMIFRVLSVNMICLRCTLKITWLKITWLLQGINDLTFGYQHKCCLVLLHGAADRILLTGHWVYPELQNPVEISCSRLWFFVS